MISIALLGNDEVWVSPDKEGEAWRQDTPHSLLGGEQEQSEVTVVEGKGSLEGSDPLDPVQLW